MIVRYYIDVSGGQHEHRAVAAAGYLASEEQWKNFSVHWAALLERAKVPYFHATEFFARKGIFKHLAGAQHDAEHAELTRLFARVARDGTGISYASGVDARCFDAAMRRVNKVLRTPCDRLTPAMFCVGNILNRAAEALLLPSSLQAAILIEKGGDSGAVLAYLHWLHNIGDPAMKAYTTWAPVDKTELPVQAADFIAHEAWREVTQALEKGGGPARESMELLAADRLVDVRFSGPLELERIAEKLLIFLEEHPEYQKRRRRRRRRNQS